LEELELINKAKAGNDSALNLLFQQNYKKLYGFLIKLTGDVYLSEDLLQETLMKAITNIKDFRGESKFLSWLIRIALNIYKNYLKRQKIIEFSSIENYSIVSDTKEMDERVYEKIQVENALKELQKLSYEKRVSFILKHYYGYSLEEISNIMNCAEGTVKSRIHNTIKTLKSLLGEKE
jgi:RNA polymerase sigma-70 factor (ECF subfamily)